MTGMDTAHAAGTVPFEVSASLGIATSEEMDGAPDLQALTRAADQRMYEAKRRRHAAES